LPEIVDALDTLLILFPDPKPIGLRTHAALVSMSQRDGLAFYDALIIASALEAGCSTVLIRGDATRSGHRWPIDNPQSVSVARPPLIRGMKNAAVSKAGNISMAGRGPPRMRRTGVDADLRRHDG